MDNQTIKITIEGPAGIGKSGVAALIRGELTRCGITVEDQDPDGVCLRQRAMAVARSIAERGTRVVIEHKTIKLVSIPKPARFVELNLGDKDGHSRD